MAGEKTEQELREEVERLTKEQEERDIQFLNNPSMKGNAAAIVDLRSHLSLVRKEVADSSTCLGNKLDLLLKQQTPDPDKPKEKEKKKEKDDERSRRGSRSRSSDRRRSRSRNSRASSRRGDTRERSRERRRSKDRRDDRDTRRDSKRDGRKYDDRYKHPHHSDRYRDSPTDVANTLVRAIMTGLPDESGTSRMPHKCILRGDEATKVGRGQCTPVSYTHLTLPTICSV